MKKHASIFLTAQSGMGKSYLATALISYLNVKRKYVIDYTAEYELPDFYVFEVNIDNYTQIPDIMHDYDYVTFRFDFASNRNIEKIVDYICHNAFHIKNCLILFEECHEYIDKRDPAKFVRMVATGGRKFGINSIFVTQRPSLLNSTIRSQTNIRISGRMTDPRDYEAIRPLFTHYYLIPRLKQRVFLYHGVNGEEMIFSTEGLELIHLG